MCYGVELNKKNVKLIINLIIAVSGIFVILTLSGIFHTKPFINNIEFSQHTGGLDVSLECLSNDITFTEISKIKCSSKVKSSEGDFWDFVEVTFYFREEDSDKSSFKCSSKFYNVSHIQFSTAGCENEIFKYWNPKNRGVYDVFVNEVYMDNTNGDPIDQFLNYESPFQEKLNIISYNEAMNNQIAFTGIQMATISLIISIASFYKELFVIISKMVDWLATIQKKPKKSSRKRK